MLRLRCQRRPMRLARKRFLLPRGTHVDTAGAVVAHVPRVVDDHGAAVDVRHIGHVHVGHRAVVEEAAASPFSAAKTYSAVSEAVVDPAVEAHIRSPTASVPTVESTRESPVTWSPQHAHRRHHPRPGDPVIAVVVIPRPITRPPQIARTGTDELRIYRQL